MAPLRTVNWLYRSLLMGLVANGLGVLAFVALAALNLEGCDRADSLAVAAFMASLLYGALLAIFLAVAMKKCQGAEGDVGKGFAVSVVIAVVLFWLAMTYTNGLPNGCP